METWQINLSLIPSISVILTSANRMALGLTDEINVRLLSNPDAFKEILPLKIKQLKRLSLAIVIMYTSLALLVLNALLTGCNFIDAAYDKYLILLLFLFSLSGCISKSFLSFTLILSGKNNSTLLWQTLSECLYLTQQNEKAKCILF